MSISRKHADSLRIDEVQLYGYDGPKSGYNGLSPPLGLLIRLRGHREDKSGRSSVESFGEAMVSPVHREKEWERLRKAASQLEGGELTLRRGLRDILWTRRGRNLLQRNELAGDGPAGAAVGQAIERLVARACGEAKEPATLRDRAGAKWPTVIAAGTASSEIDFKTLAQVTDWFEVYPPAEEPYPAPRNTYSGHRMPGAPHGLPQLYYFELAALRYGLTTRRYSNRFLLAEQPGNEASIGFSAADSTHVSIPSCTVVKDKLVAKAILGAAGVPVPQGFTLTARQLRADVDAFERQVQKLGFPLVAKPARGHMGYGVTANITSMGQLHQAIDRIAESEYGSGRIIVERHVKGSDYRVFATDQKVLCVMKRTRAAVIGNGRHTVAELMVWAGAIRRSNPNLSRIRFKFDVVANVLAEQGLDFSSVPKSGQEVWLARSDSISQGGVSTELLDQTHQSILDASVSAVQAVGMPYAGIDFFLEDHRKPLESQESSVIEVNNAPGTLGHLYPMFGRGVDVVAELVALTAQRSGIEVTEAVSGDMTVEMRISGHVRNVGFCEWLTKVATELGLDGWVFSTGDDIAAVVSGPQMKVLNLLKLSFKGPAKGRPEEIVTQPVSTVVPPGFENRDRSSAAP
ncbi:acylphosphatase [Natronoglycomyces albus]|uniref:Acylphosphatase n=1 Tax=Natronoglycomyces albus TaxID=2811108 RepID=A0A895XHJ2_9ACTN|nr:acylphosphatase [Natronoglycomyces albus]QSB04814.1 acylphosphatase [Natronoglycomyces albus]